MFVTKRFKRSIPKAHFRTAPDDIGAGAGEPQNTNPQQQQQDTPTQPPADNMIPKSRFDEVNNKFKDVQAQLEALLKEKQDKELEAQKQRGEFEELYKSASTELEQYKAQTEQYTSRVTELEGVIQSLVDAKLAEIPEDFHDLIPAGMTPEQKLSWITTAQAKGLFGTQPAQNPLEQQPLGDPTNNNNKPNVDITKMSALDMFLAAYGKK
jgi:DNA gyrase/topoisomerase IV subunit A